MRNWWVAAACCCSMNAAAQEQRPRIVVSGTGSVTTPPDVATIEYRIVGEGVTSDEAVTAMIDKRRRIAAGLASLGSGIEPRASEVAVAEVRSPDCRQTYGQAQLSVGACAITGYTASIQNSIRTAAVKQAGTIVGLIGRLGGRDPRLTGFLLADAGPAQRRAIAAALADARVKAQAIAQGAGVSLGRLVSASTGGYVDTVAQDIGVLGSVPPPPPPPPPMVSPITVDLSPRPVETRAQVTVAYEIAA